MWCRTILACTHHYTSEFHLGNWILLGARLNLFYVKIKRTTQPLDTVNFEGTFAQKFWVIPQWKNWRKSRVNQRGTKIATIFLRRCWFWWFLVTLAHILHAHGAAHVSRVCVYVHTSPHVCISTLPCPQSAGCTVHLVPQILRRFWAMCHC